MPAWIPITSDDNLKRALEMLWAMDRRYSGLTLDQLKDWITQQHPDKLPFSGSNVYAFGWFPTTSDKPSLMEACVLVRLFKADPNVTRPSRADVVTVAWHCAPSLATGERTDLIIDQLLQKAADWIGQVNAVPGYALKSLRAVRPKSSNRPQIQQLYDRLHERATSNDAHVKLLGERDLGDAVFWELQIS